MGDANSKVPEVLLGVMSTGLDEALTVEDYARMAQASAEQWEEALIDRVVELSPDQFCALFDLAQRGLRDAR